MPAGFGIGPGHIEAAERVDAYQGAGAFPVQIQVADMEVAPGLLQVRAIVRDHRAGQPVVGIVGEWIASSKEAAFVKATTGPKISSWEIRAVLATSAKIVGCMKYPPDRRENRRGPACLRFSRFRYSREFYGTPYRR